MPETVVSWQTPFWFAPDFVHLPEQHSEFAKHESFVCRQNDVADEHVPPTQDFEQQSALFTQALPEPRQTLVSGWQRLP